MKIEKLLTLFAAASLCQLAEGAITLPAFMSDNMVVQQNSDLTLRGTASPGAVVSVRSGWTDKVAKTKAADDGTFSLKISTPAAGGPYTMSVADKDGEVVLNNILSGEVWLCSGQSNMEFPVKGWTTVMDYDRIIPTAQHPDIRLLQVAKQASFTPQTDCRVNMGGWVECNSATVPEFSAVAYLYALELLQELKVPVGVIDATWGGTPAEAWTSLGGVSKVPGFENEVYELKSTGGDAAKMQADYDAAMEEWMALVAAKMKEEGNDGRSGKMPTGTNWENGTLSADFDGVVKMSRTVEITAGLAGKPLTLYLGAIDDEDITRFNGVEIARGSGFDTPRVYTVPAEFVKEGTATIEITATDFGGGGGFNGGDTMRAEADGTVIPLEGEWDYAVAVDFASLPSKPVSVGGGGYPTVLYNAMIHPLANMPVRGVIWYQGCANVGRHEQYAPLFKQLITDWRQLWQRPEMPFNFVQLAGFLKPSYCQPESEWAALRDAQASALELPNTAMATAIDLGNPDDIHPRNKQDVAHRLATIALGRQYGKDVVCKAPEMSEAKAKGGKLTLKFNAPLTPTSSALTGFIIAGKDGKFALAYGKLIDDTTVELSSPAVKDPVTVRYNWADYPGGNLYGQTGLPVAPFKSDK